MKTKLAALAILPVLALSQSKKTHFHEFAPPNDMRIPVSQNFSGITEEDFKDVLDQVEKVYAPIFKSHEAEFVIERFWTNDTVNAYAYRNQSKWTIAMYGGLARHKEVTKDSFMLVACHEIGHHLGGFPRGGWASNEGNSDYYGTLKCLRRMWNSENSIDVVAKMKVDKKAAELCLEQWNSKADQAICQRAAMAGKSLGRLLADLGQQSMPEFDTPDTSVVKKTSHSHPAAQCRLDTYFHGALCGVDYNKDMSETDPNDGACKAGEIGGRRQCWYSESNEPTPPEEDPNDGGGDEGVRW